MTNEEAIMELCWISRNGYVVDKPLIGTDRINESLLMAIQALKKQTQKTYMEDLFEKYPNAKLNPIDGMPLTCRHSLYGEESDCDNDCVKCWNEMMEDDK